jgi:hypothetical protein
MEFLFESVILIDRNTTREDFHKVCSDNLSTIDPH